MAVDVVNVGAVGGGGVRPVHQRARNAGSVRDPRAALAHGPGAGLLAVAAVDQDIARRDARRPHHLQPARPRQLGLLRGDGGGGGFCDVMFETGNPYMLRQAQHERISDTSLVTRRPVTNRSP